MYQCSKGIIDQLINIFTYMNIDYILKDGTEKPVVNAEYVQKTVGLHFPTVQELLNSGSDDLTQKQEQALLSSRLEKEEEIRQLYVEQLMLEEKNEKDKTGGENAGEAPEDLAVIRDKAIHSLKMVFKNQYTDESIEKKVTSAMHALQKKNEALSTDAVLSEASMRLLKGKSDARPVKSRPGKAKETIGEPEMDRLILGRQG